MGGILPLFFRAVLARKMAMNQAFAAIKNWLNLHPGIFNFREESHQLELKENYSQKSLRIEESEVERHEEKINSAQSGQTYLVLLLTNGRQLVLANQGFIFAPDFTNTGPLPLPSPVYCMQDFNQIFHRLRHV